jgi:S1-C subfamily serine protease
VSPSRIAVVVLAVLASLLPACTSGDPLGIGAGPAAGPSEISPLPPLPTGQGRIVRVVRAVRPAVVNVTAELGGGEDAEGTGFVVGSEGTVITNFHVVEQALSIRVITAGGDTFDGRVIGADPEGDLAVVELNSDGALPTVPLGDSDGLQLGQTVVALGFALGLEGGPSVTSGIVSAMGRTIDVRDEALPGCDQDTGQGCSRTYEDLIQTDAAINPGNSGGPLVDLRGRVVGINTAGVGAGSAENIGFAIAIDRAKPVLDRAVRNPEAPAPFLGVSTQNVTPDVAAFEGLSVDEGVLVVALAPDGPAEQAGIEVGDVIVAVDGEPVADNEDLQARLLEHEPEQDVEVRVVRGSSTLDITVTLGVRPLPVEQG